MNQLNKELKDNFLKNQNFINNNFNNNKNYNLNSESQLIAKANILNYNSKLDDDTNLWDEGMYNQLKAQIVAYRYLIRYQHVPEEILTAIVNYHGSSNFQSKNKQLSKNLETLKNKFKDYDMTMKELAPFFKRKIKEHDLKLINSNNNKVMENTINATNGLNSTEYSKNNKSVFSNEIDFSYENEIDFRKKKFKMLIDMYDSNKSRCIENNNNNNNNNNNKNEDYVLYLNTQQQLFFGFKSNIDKNDRIMLEKQYKFLNLYNLQTKVRKEVLSNHINDIEKQSNIYYTDVLFEKTLLDRKTYKRAITDRTKKDQKINDRFEQQLRHGYDIRKKNKHRDFINDVLQLQKEFYEYYKDKKNKQRKRALMVKTFIDVREKRDIQAKEKSDRDRLKFLKDNDIDRYVKLLKEAKNTRLLDFMGQTSAFIKEIEDKVAIQKEANKEIKEVTKNDDNVDINPDANNTNNNLKFNTDEHNTQESNNKEKNYYSTAHTIIEDIVKQPTTLIGGTLKSYQLAGLRWMVSLYNNNLNGILADEMGLGKTIQTISLLTYIVEYKKNNGPFLIVVPLSTVSNWTNEFAKWSPSLKVIVYKGSPAERKAYAHQLRTYGENTGKMSSNNFNQYNTNNSNNYNVNNINNNNTFSNTSKFKVIITTYEYVMKDKYALNKVFWQYIIVDEGHRMKNAKSKFTQTLGTQFKSACRLLLTGTPLQNNLSELWALLNFLLPKIFNSCDEFEKWFNQPFSNKLGGNSGDRQNFDLNEEERLLIINRLHQVLRPFLLRREKKEVEKELPSKTEHIVKIELSAWQKIVYKQISNAGILARDPTTGKLGNKALINVMMQLKKICNHPYLFLERDNPIFYNELSDDIYRCSGKFELLDRIIPKLLRFNHKILIFSQMTQLMDILQLYLNYKGLAHLRLDGNTKAEERGKQMDMFNDPNTPYKIFILSTRAGGLGLNLQTADTVVIFDSDWNPQMDNQAQDRAHRIGQRNEVRVFRLITTTEIEEEILNKAGFKKSLDDIIIKAGAYNSTSSENESKKKLEELIKQGKEDNENCDQSNNKQIPNDDEINKMLARSAEELEAFQEMDKERYIKENKKEIVQKILLKQKEVSQKNKESESNNNKDNLSKNNFEDEESTFNKNYTKSSNKYVINNKTYGKNKKYTISKNESLNTKYYLNKKQSKSSNIEDDSMYFENNNDNNSSINSDDDENNNIDEEKESINYRLMTEEEVPYWVKGAENTCNDTLNNHSNVEYGKGMRVRAKVDYKDDVHKDVYNHLFSNSNEENQDISDSNNNDDNNDSYLNKNNYLKKKRGKKLKNNSTSNNNLNSLIDDKSYNTIKYLNNKDMSINEDNNKYERNSDAKSTTRSNYYKNLSNMNLNDKSSNSTRKRKLNDTVHQYQNNTVNMIENNNKSKINKLNLNNDSKDDDGNKIKIMLDESSN